MAPAPDVAFLDLTEVAGLLREGSTTSVKLTEMMLERIAAHDPHLNAFVTITAASALQAAQRADTERAQGLDRGVLHGVPVAVKDLMLTADAPTASGGVLAAPATTQEATAVARLREAGAVLLGKLRLTEGAWADHHPAFPAPVNPWDAGTWVGGSSSGSAVAAAAGLCFAALGSDTGGSIRVPSSMCGVSGFKPSWGRVSRHGVSELAASLDHIGPMARSAADCAAVLAAIAGWDQLDPTSSAAPLAAIPAPSELNAAGAALRVGVDPALVATFDPQIQQLLAQTTQVLTDLGWSVVEVTTPDLPTAATLFEPSASVETAAAHQDSYARHRQHYGTALASQIEAGLAMSAVEYKRLQDRRRAFAGQMHHLFTEIDLLLLPGMGFASPTVARMEELGDSPELLSALLTPTAPISLAGLPSLTMPGGFTDRGTPLAFQLVGGALQDHRVLAAGMAFQEVTDHHRRHPVLPQRETQP